MNKKIDNIRIADYRYDLPTERIAKHPLSERDTSKLLVYKDGIINDENFSNLGNFLPDESVIIRNNTKVIQARIQFQKETGANIEVFCLEPAKPADYESNLSKKKSASWYCLVGNSKKWKTGKLSSEIEKDGQKITITAERKGIVDGKEEIVFSWSPTNLTLSEILDQFGKTPIPPYLQRDSEPSDKKRYQTIYAQLDGSVAAPTAGLHFTDRTEEQLKNKKITTTEVTLHVGAGTFTPVKSQTIAGHSMHTEHLLISRDMIHDFLNNDKNGITAIGTTSLRTLESLYWLGYLLHHKKIDLEDHIHIDQWLPYSADSKLTRRQALLEILVIMANRQIETISFTTSLIIVPGYRFNMVDRLLTNFHQPGSTLLLLVGAFVGTDWVKIYEHALSGSYRFLSYGDSSLLFLKQN